MTFLGRFAGGASVLLGFVGLNVLPSCGRSSGPPLSQVSPARPARVFDYLAVNGERLSTEKTRGRATVIVFVTTYDLGSQIVLRQLVELARTHRPRINVGAVVLEPPRNAPLVQAFSDTMELPFPVALADAATLGGRGPFGVVEAVPTVVVLAPDGVERWRRSVVVPASVLKGAVDLALQRER